MEIGMLTVFYNHVEEAMRQENLTLEEIASKIKEHGITGLEFDYYDLVKKGYFDVEFANKLKDLGIPVAGAYVNFDWGNKPFDNSYKKIYKNLQSIGVKYSLAIPGMVRDGADKEKYMKRMAKVLKKAVMYAKKCGIQVLMEDFDDYHAPFSTSEGMLYFMKEVPGLKIAFDTGNFYYSDEDAFKVLPKFIDDTEYVHCKDRSLEVKDGEEPKPNINGVNMYSSAVGEGVIPMKDILMKLKEHGYKGTYAIEHFGSMHHLRDMIASADYLNSLDL